MTLILPFTAAISGVIRGLVCVLGLGHQIGLAIEFGVVPLVLLWQARLARRFSA